MVFAIERPREVDPALDAAGRIRVLAAKHRISFVPGRYDALAGQAGRLMVDDVCLDEIEVLLIALRRADVVDGHEATRLHGEYLRAIA